MPDLLLAAQRTSRSSKLAAWESARSLFDASVDELAEGVAAGRITPREWEAAMRPLVKDLHVEAYVAGRSGLWGEITPAQWGRLGPVVREQYGYLARRRQAIEAVPVEERSAAKLAQTARLYGAATRRSFERGLLDEIGMGAELPAYPGDGTTLCRVNCRCRWRIRILSKARGDFDASWTLGSAEHCRTCRERARKWKALRVRGGVLVDGYEPISD